MKTFITIKHLLFWVSLCLLSPAVIWGQSTIEEDLKKAQFSFDEGKLDEAIEKINAIDDKDIINKNLLEQKYKLKTLSYIFLNRESGDSTQLLYADSAYITLLKNNPIYEPDTNDIVDLLVFSKKFRSTPFFSIGLRGGSGIVVPSAITSYGINNLSIPQLRYSNLSFNSFQVGLNADLTTYYIPSLEFTFGIFYGQKSYTLKETLHTFGNDLEGISDNAIFNELTAIENQTWIDIPIGLKYNIGKHKFVNYYYGGIEYNFLRSSQFSTINRTIGTRSTQENGYDLDIGNNSLRKRQNLSLMIGLGFKYRIGKDFIVLDGKFSRQLLGVNNISNRYTGTDANYLNFRYGYVDNDIRLNTIFISAGFVYSFYKAKKIKD